jgi:hypothetical protein
LEITISEGGIDPIWSKLVEMVRERNKGYEDK